MTITLSPLRSVLQTRLDFYQNFFQPFDRYLDFCEATVGVIRDPNQRADDAQKVGPVHIDGDSVHRPIVGGHAPDTRHGFWPD